MISQKNEQKTSTTAKTGNAFLCVWVACDRPRLTNRVAAGQRHAAVPSSPIGWLNAKRCRHLGLAGNGRTGQSHVKGVSGPNLAPNPGFEDGTPGQLPAGWRWQAHPTDKSDAGVCTEQAASGKQSLRIEGDAGVNSKGQQVHPVVVSQTFPATPGTSYVLTAKMRADKPGRRAGLRAQSYVANAYFWSRGSQVVLDPSWHEVRLVFRFPKPGDGDYKAEMKRLAARVDMLDAEGVIWVDDVDMRVAEGADEWESWHALGMDTHSLIADPLFIDPDEDNYRLHPESPAFKLGFQPIPFDKIGPYADPLRATWPIVEAKGFRELVAGAKAE